VSKTLTAVAALLELIRRLADHFRRVKRENDRQDIMDDPHSHFVGKYGVPDTTGEEGGGDKAGNESPEDRG